MDLTTRFQLLRFTTLADEWSVEDYRFSNGDRATLDALLALAVEAHRHTGLAATSTPPAAPAVTYIGDPTVHGLTGGLPAGRTVYYRSTYTMSELEGTPSAIASIQTPAPLPTPPTPVATVGTGGLAAGTYDYAVSWATYESSEETLLSTPTSTTVPANSSVVVALPRANAADVTCNVYRRVRGGAFEFVANTAASEYVDTGTFAGSTRGEPTVNSTYSRGVVVIDPAELATTDAYTVTTYRTYDPTSWARSTLDPVTAVLGLVDDGKPTSAGQPPANVDRLGTAPKVSLDAETEGGLTGSGVVASAIASWYWDEVVHAGLGSAEQWVNEYDVAIPTSARAWLEVGSAPASRPTAVRLERHSAGWAAGTWEWVTDLIIAIGTELSDAALLAGLGLLLGPGDTLRARALQGGGGATPTDRGLHVEVQLLGRYGDVTLRPATPALPGPEPAPDLPYLRLQYRSLYDLETLTEQYYPDYTVGVDAVSDEYTLTEGLVAASFTASGTPQPNGATDDFIVTLELQPEGGAWAPEATLAITPTNGDPGPVSLSVDVPAGTKVRATTLCVDAAFGVDALVATVDLTGTTTTAVEALRWTWHGPPAPGEWHLVADQPGAGDVTADGSVTTDWELPTDDWNTTMWGLSISGTRSDVVEEDYVVRLEASTDGGSSWSSYLHAILHPDNTISYPDAGLTLYPGPRTHFRFSVDATTSPTGAQDLYARVRATGAGVTDDVAFTWPIT